MKKGFVKGTLIVTGVVLASTGIILGAGAFEKTNDITAPYGSLVVQGAHQVNNVNYVGDKSVVIEIIAEDDTCEDNEIKYYLSTSPISDVELLDESLWKTYSNGVTETINLDSISSPYKIYAMFKDKYGNTSGIFSGDAATYTVTFDANGGESAPSAQNVYYGMSLNLTMERPINEGKYFVGWSTLKGSSMADYEGTTIYKQGDTISANAFTGEEKNITLYAVWADEISELPLLSENVKVGDYVNYPVKYENVNTYSGEYKAVLTGWRVLSKDVDIDGNASPGTVNLVSAGVPLTYYHFNNSETSIKNLTMKFLDIPFAVTGNYVFSQTGFNPYTTLKELFNNKYTATYGNKATVSYTSTYENGTSVTYTGEKAAGDLKVRAMTKEDLDKVYVEAGGIVTTQETYVTNVKYGKLFAIPSTSTQYTHYWLASAYDSNYLRNVNGSGYINNGDQVELGIRPVVSLKANVKTTGMDMTGAWDIEVD